MSLRKIYYNLPPGLRFLMRRLIYLPSDLLDQVTRQNKSIPPKGSIYTGGGDFMKSGEKFKNLIVQFCDLKPEDSILDIGSGIGRLAIPLSGYLNKEGIYEGFDIIKKGIIWCKENISNKHPNFNFTHVELDNDLYTRSGKPAEKYDFLFEENKFDCTAAVSVYTHLLIEELEQYLRESKRVMKSGAKGLATFFIISNESELKSNPDFSFKYNDGIQYLMDKNVKRANVAYKHKFLFDLIEQELGFKIDHYFKGSWSNPQAKSVDFQDIIVFSKK